MKKSFLFLILGFLLISTSENLYAGIHPDDDPVPNDWQPGQPYKTNTFNPEEYSGEFSFEDQIKKAQILKDQHHTLLWAIGASNRAESPNEEIKRFPPYTVFTDFNGRTMDPKGPAHFWMNVRNVQSLQKLPSNFFDEIHVDRATMHQFTWEINHLKEIFRILTPGGNFTFQYVPNVLMDWTSEERTIDRAYVPPYIVLNAFKILSDGLVLDEEKDFAEYHISLIETKKTLKNIGFPEVKYNSDILYPYSDFTLNFFTMEKPWAKGYFN